MNVGRIKAQLQSLREEMAAKINALEKALEEEAGDSAFDSPWMKVPTYATYARVSPDTVRRWVDEGLRAAGAATGTGRLTRIHREKADEWRRSQ